jgi:hypothetical protein
MGAEPDEPHAAAHKAKATVNLRMSMPMEAWGEDTSGFGQRVMHFEL